MVDIHLDSSTAKAYLCYQGSTASLFLSRLVCHILYLADKHSITLILSVEADYVSQC